MPSLEEARREARERLRWHDDFVRANGLVDDRTEHERDTAVEELAKWIVANRADAPRPESIDG